MISITVKGIPQYLGLLYYGTFCINRSQTEQRMATYISFFRKERISHQSFDFTISWVRKILAKLIVLEYALELIIVDMMFLFFCLNSF